MSTGAGLGPGAGDALLLVDLQRDFMPGGSLAVPGGDAVIPVANRYLELFHARRLPVFASRCWHPPDHCSFQPQGGRWPVHCVQGTAGAEFAEGLALPADVEVVSKATEPDREAYSAFDGTGLAGRLRELGVRRLFVGGVATDYCVLASVLAAREAGLDVVLLTDAIRAVDARPGDGPHALERMLAAGAVPATLAEVDAAD